MRILVCSTQVPFSHGGAELLSNGLVAALHEHGHQAELVALPFAWTPRSNLVKSALAWRLLDLTQIGGRAVDAVVATKYPSYAVRHPRKLVWLVHQHRQAYDWYGTPMSDWGAQDGDAEARKLIQRMDRRTLGEARGLWAISRNVAARLRRFNGLESRVLYPPSHLAPRLRPGPFEGYLLSLSRLDRAKRADLLLDAMARSRSGLRAVVAGRGPALEDLRRQVRQLGLADRVAFPGFVDDSTAAELLTRCRAVYYAPIDEDYGFATVEAFAAGKPVLTASDAGGVLEFVTHDQSGLVAAPSAAALAEQIDRLADEHLARRLGADNPQRVAQITWPAVVAALGF